MTTGYAGWNNALWVEIGPVIAGEHWQYGLMGVSDVITAGGGSATVPEPSSLMMFLKITRGLGS